MMFTTTSRNKTLFSRGWLCALLALSCLVVVSSTTSLEERRPQDLSDATLWSSESDQVDRLLEGHLLETASNETLLEEEEEEHHDEEEEHHDEEEEHLEGHDDHDMEGHEDHDDHSDHEDHDDHSDHDDHGSLAASALLESGSDKPWGDVIVVALIINLITLTGVLFLSGEFFAKHVLKRDIVGSPYYTKFTHLIIPSFACGALMATTVFLVLPEALYLISAHFSGSGEEGEDAHAGHGHRFLEDEGHEEEENAEGAAIWRFGACIIGGFLLPILTAALFPHNHHDLEEVIETEGVPAGANGELDTLKEEVEGETAIKVMEEQPAAMTVKTDSGSTGSDTLPLPIDWPLAASIMAGDFFHNFADGIFVGTAFLLCDRDLAITISAATIYHEIAQEVADYFMLTRFCNIPPAKALCLNFINGLSVMLGAILIVAIEDMTNVAIGSILAVSSGVYIYISVAECYPRAKEAQKTVQDKLISLLSFVVGVVPIGLVLLNHSHCEAGHNH